MEWIVQSPLWPAGLSVAPLFALAPAPPVIAWPISTFWSAVLLFAFFTLGMTTIYIMIWYAGVVVKIFQTNPLFIVRNVEPDPEAEHVEIMPEPGRKIVGSYLKTTWASRRGVIVFCHEYSGNRWLSRAYLKSLRQQGYDIFTFDFCNHGQSDFIKRYQSYPWLTHHETTDVQAVVNYLKSRPDADPRGIGLFGVSRGGSAALVVAARDPYVKAVITDGAFPTRGMMIHYERRFVNIYTPIPGFWKLLPRALFRMVTEYVLLRLGDARNVRYERVQRAVCQLKAPWLMIHGACDNYVNRDVIDRWYGRAKGPREQWLVPKAKHNQGLNKCPDEYAQRINEFFEQHLGRLKEVATIAPQAADGPLGLASTEQEPSLLSPAVGRRVPASPGE